MQSVTVMFRAAKWKAILPAIFFVMQATAQINSPYSRYGLGDIYNARNVVSKAMGNVATAYSDYTSINFVNPASYSKLQLVTFDVSMEMELRTLMNADRTEQTQSNYLLFNYMAVGVPLAKDKKGMTKWGMSFGIRPYSRVGYNIREDDRLPGIDSTTAYYQGSGGGYRAFLGMGYRIGNFSIGANAGYLFGQKDISTERLLISDTTFYFSSLQDTRTSYNNFGFDGGFQYKIKLGKETVARIGANGFIGNTVNATQYKLRQTYLNNPSTGIDSIDVIQRTEEQKGTIEMPTGYTAAIAFEKEGKWMLSGEYESVSWSEFKFLDEPNVLANTELFRFGGYYVPAPNDAKKYFKRVTYRAGFYTGKDMIVIQGTQLPVWGATMGFSLPIKKYSAYSTQYSTVNMSMEFGRRGNDQVPMSERFFRLNVGLSLSDLWFQKRKFD
ncbi:MAG TPA: hypothetical protein VLC98_10325 [Phnomibacter sp.]|nr:hypothetical protein [Phnomibacter sp.]